MIEPRVYRAAFVPALLVVVLAMFSLEHRPGPPLSQDQILAADVLFDGNLAAAAARRIASARPDRRPGSLGDRETGDLVASRLESFGFRAERDRYSSGGHDLENVIGRRAGVSQRQIVVVAPRDAGSVPDTASSASDTAALLELARVFQGRPSRKTIVLASVDGTTLGEEGTRRLVGELDAPGETEAVIVMSNLGARLRSGSPIVTWSDDTTRTGIALERTAAAALRAEVSGRILSTGLFGQLAHLAFPIGIGPQGVLLESGYEAVRLSGSGELPPKGAARSVVDPNRIGSLGRSVLRVVSVLDKGGAGPGPRTYLVAFGQVLPAWVLALLSLTLLAPAVVAAVDAFARARRRREPILPGLRWVGLLSLAFAAGLAMVGLLALAGATPDPLGAPVPPALNPVGSAALAVLAALGATIALSLAAVRVLKLRPNPAAPGAGCAVGLTLAVAILVLWLLNPFAALVMVPAVHCWTLLVLVDPPPGPRTRVVLIAVGLALPLLAAVYYLLTLHVNPVLGLWYLLLLAIGGGIGLPTALLGCVLLGALVAVVTIARALPAPRSEGPQGPSVRGPSSYAGPGSLGGTESAFRR